MLPRRFRRCPRALSKLFRGPGRAYARRMAKTALITGASAGLGAEYARLFAADGHDVALVARRRDKLEELAAELRRKHGIQAHVLPEDLTDREAPARLAAELERRGVAIEFLVNNAGFGTLGAFATAELGRELDEVQVNVTALAHLTGLLLPAMIARGSGRVLNVGSTAGFQPGPFMATYYATKAFVNSFTQALAFEVRGTGVTVTLSAPGATHTEFGAISGNAETQLFLQGGAMSASAVAEHAFRAMMRGDAVAVPGLKNKLGIQALRVAPRSVVVGIAARLNRP